MNNTIIFGNKVVSTVGAEDCVNAFCMWTIHLSANTTNIHIFVKKHIFVFSRLKNALQCEFYL